MKLVPILIVSFRLERGGQFESGFQGAVFLINNVISRASLHLRHERRGFSDKTGQINPLKLGHE